MGEYFAYANLDRGEYFLVSALGGALKSVGVGRNLGARALGLLLVARGRSIAPTGAQGTWAGDRIAVVGDSLGQRYVKTELAAEVAAAEETGQSLFARMEASYENILPAVALMLLRDDGPEEIVEAAERCDDLFVVLAELALLHRQDDVGRALRQRFGEDWQKRYAAKRRTSRIMVPGPRRGPGETS